MESVDCVVIGAGVIGLAIARALSLSGREVFVLEREFSIGTGVSSRNSEVIHAGMYYPRGSLKAQLCVRGNRLLRDHVVSHGVPFRLTGKLIVAVHEDDHAKLRAILDLGRANGVPNLTEVSAAAARNMEPELYCTTALWSPDTGIVDCYGLMLSYQGEAEANGATVIFGAPVESGRIRDDGIEIQVGGEDPVTLKTHDLVIAAGLHSCRIASTIGIPAVPKPYICKGNYFSLTGKAPFQRLIYPLPHKDGLGIHYTLDLGGRGRFGPDVEWVKNEDYAVDSSRAGTFYAAIRNYWPCLRDGMLEPSYSGIRPKISGPEEATSDFMIAGPETHGIAGVVALYGIESPGLTASLAVAERVVAVLHRV